MRSIPRGKTLNVGTHHLGDAAHLGEVPQFILIQLLASMCLPKCLQCDIEPDLVSVLEAVSNSLWHIGYAHGHAIEVVLVEPFSQCLCRESNNAERGIIQFWRTCLAGYRKPDFMG